MQLANNLDTIAAIATPSGAGGIGVVRVSGSKAHDVAKHLLGLCPENRLASYLPFLDSNGQVIDRGIALFFKSPHSYRRRCIRTSRSWRHCCDATFISALH